MSDTLPPADPIVLDHKIEAVDDEGIPAGKAKKRAKRAAAKAAERGLLARLFGIGIWGTLKLTVLCILIGFFVMAANFDPRHPDVDAGAAIVSVAKQAWAATGWGLRNFWKPALAGASVVLPIWVIWRLVSLPFRKS